jgi:hypothetical protein
MLNIQIIAGKELDPLDRNFAVRAAGVSVPMKALRPTHGHYSERLRSMDKQRSNWAAGETNPSYRYERDC